ncbi:Gfo/Idh/MocA family oxidoreductase [soil metagenome]
MNVTAAAATGVAVQSPPLGVAVVGCGLIGRRRAASALAHPRTTLRVLIDRVPAAAQEVAGPDCSVSADWQTALDRTDVDIIVVSTPNNLLAEVAITAMQAGKHVLLEKPMGRNLDEALRIHAAAVASGRVLQVGFNHRFHPGIRRAAELIREGAIGRLISVRARYGHGGRPGLEKEWRSDPEQAGGGELIDQGVHLADLIHWMAGMPVTAFGHVQTAVWPIEPLEDNAWGLLRFANGAVAQLHVSMTQWKNMFSLEVHGDAGAVTVEGLGGSYGVERLTRVDRAVAGGVPAVNEEIFEGADGSWAAEWEAFMGRIDGATADRGGRLPNEAGDRAGTAGSADDGLAAMRIVDALYRSASAGVPVPL